MITVNWVVLILLTVSSCSLNQAKYSTVQQKKSININNEKSMKMENDRKSLFGEVVSTRQVYMELYGPPSYPRSKILFDKSYSVLHELAVRYDAEINVDKSTLMGKELIKNCEKVIELSAKQRKELELTLKNANTQEQIKAAFGF